MYQRVFKDVCVNVSKNFVSKCSYGFKVVFIHQQIHINRYRSATVKPAKLTTDISIAHSTFPLDGPAVINM